jgi:hypothetical protein
MVAALMVAVIVPLLVVLIVVAMVSASLLSLLLVVWVVWVDEVGVWMLVLVKAVWMSALATIHLHSAGSTTLSNEHSTLL